MLYAHAPWRISAAPQGTLRGFLLKRIIYNNDEVTVNGGAIMCLSHKSG